MKQPSDLEARIINALDKLKIRYVFQYELWGGTSFRGGVIVDFLILNPFPIPVEAYGDYWHKDDLSSEERLRLARIEQCFQREVKIIWGHEAETQEDADRVVEDRIGGATF